MDREAAKKALQSAKATGFFTEMYGEVPLRMKSAMSMFLRDSKSHSGGIR